MEEHYNDLEPQVASSIADELSAQAHRSFDKVVETDWRLTQHNFFVNAGGAAAVLAFMGSESPPQFLVWPLSFFISGVIASGIEIRVLLRFYDLLHKDALRRMSGFSANSLTVRDALPPNKLGGKSVVVNHLCGWLSQAFFVAGAVLGLLLYLNDLKITG